MVGIGVSWGTVADARGRLTVPLVMRKKLGLARGDQLKFTMLSDGAVIVSILPRRRRERLRVETNIGEPF